MLATTKTVRKFARGIYGKTFDTTWTDMSKRVSFAKDNGVRYVAFRLFNKADADRLAENLQLTLFAAGYTNKVRRTTVDSDWMTRNIGGEYVRVKALLG